MFTRHLLAILMVVIGVVVGIIVMVQDNWKTGLITGVVIIGLGFVFAIMNMIGVARSFSKEFKNF